MTQGLDKISASQFFKEFKQEYEKRSGRSGIHKWSVWTRDNLSFLKDLGEELGYAVLIEKPVRMDMTWFDPKYLDPQVAIEYETNEKTVLESEVLNLACSSARLKVLITYVKEGTQEDFLNSVCMKWATRSKRSTGDELLVMLIVFNLENGKRIFSYYDCYRIRGKTDSGNPKSLGQVMMYL